VAMSAVLLSNWFPIRAYDSDNDPRLPGVSSSTHLLNLVSRY